MNSDLNSLTDMVLDLTASTENKKRIALWKPTTSSAEAYWHGRPNDGAVGIPYTIEPEHEMWAKILGFNLDEYYTNGPAYLLADLNMKIYRFQNFQDGTPIGTTVSLWMGAGFEATFYGMEQKYTRDKDPWVGREPILRHKGHLDQLPVPDFHTSPSMVQVHEMVQEMNEMIDDSFNIVLPEWCRGPFGLACHLRGMDTIVVDMIEDPRFVHDLMRLTTDTRKKWAKQRAEYLKIPVQPGSLYNDEVTVPMISPRFYEEFVLPYEIELSEFYAGITYWHSCGNIAPLIPLIRTIPGLEMLHISPWTDLPSSVETLKDTQIALEVVLHPLKHVQAIDGSEIKSHLMFIRETTRSVPVTVRADGLQNITSLEDDIKKIQEWAEIAQEIFC